MSPLNGAKGTQSDLLVEKYGYVHISTGDLLRNVDPESDLRKEIERIIMSGALVSDEIVVGLLKEKLLTLKDNEPFVLDGFPRNIEQAEKLEVLLKDINRTLDVVIYLDVPYEVSLKRTLGRLSCPKCKATYNEFYKPSKIDGICDKCGTALAHRPEDNEETFNLRYETYLKETTPLIDYYKRAGKLVSVESKNVDDTFASVVSVASND